jgi:hypothetical protein
MQPYASWKEGAAGQFADLAVGCGRAGEADHGDVRVGDQRLARVCAAGQDGQHAVRPPGLLENRARTTPPDTAVCGSGLSTTALPRARAGATDLVERMSGKLNGAITPTTPMGIRRARLSLGLGTGNDPPVSVVVSGMTVTVLVNGEIVTADEQFSVVEAIAIDGDRIIATGSTVDVLAADAPGPRSATSAVRR